MTPPELQSSLSEWQSLTQWLSQAKEKEMTLRLKLANHFFADKLQPNGALPEGTMNLEQDGFKIKVVGKMNRTVLEEVRAAAMEEAKLTVEEAKDIFKLKAELSISAYKALSEEKKKIIDKAIVVKSGSPTLEIEPV